ERDAHRPRLCRRSLRGGNAEKAQALPIAPSESRDRESRSRAGTESDNHAILDQVDRCLRRRTLEGISIGIGQEWSRATGYASSACAHLRIAAMAALYSLLPKIAEPATIAVAPAATACLAVAWFSPPSTSITGSSPRCTHISRTR